MAMFSLWWAWLCAALLLAIAEVLIPGFIFLGFAIGAVITALLLALGLNVSASALLLIFAACSLIAWLALRRMFASPEGQVKTFDHDVND